jgi:hypothetical protein
MKYLFGLFVAFLSVSATAQMQNWRGYLDTTTVFIKDSVTMKYSKVYTLTENENMSLVIMANDTVAAGLSSDSTKLIYGVQLGNPVINASGNLDTAWGVKDTLDIISNVGYGTSEGGGRITSADAISETWGKADTSMVTGFATQIRAVKPYWACYMRVWINGLTGTRLATANKVRIALLRRIGVVTIQK